MKKIILFLLASVVLVSTGFANGSDEGEMMDDTYIAVISKGFQHQFWQAVKMGTEKAAEELGIRTTYTGPATEAMVDVQINMVENAITTQSDGLLLAALDSEALIPLAEKANASGITVATFDSGINSDLPVTHVATNNLAAAALAADKMAEAVGGRGKVGVLVHDFSSQTGIERRDGFVNRVNEAYPDIEIVGPIEGKGDAQRSADLITDMLRSNPDLVGIFAANEGSAIGAGIAVQEMNAVGKVVLIGFDSGSTQKQYIRDGVELGVVSQDPVNIGYLGVIKLYEAMTGKTVDKVIDTGAVWVDINNLDDPGIQPILYD